MSAAIPTTIADYLDQLRDALKGADPALIQDALYDAEEHLRSELAENRGISEADLLARMATTYGVPEEVAEIYRDKEIHITRALRTPPRKPSRSAAGQFFGVIADPRAYASLFYMLLSLATGVFYFSFVVTGISLSLGLAILIIGVPIAVLFLGLVHVLSLVEGRMVEVMLGERMPRRPVYPAQMGFWARIGNLVTDPRTWTTMLYFLLMLPLGTLYFSVVVTGLSVSLAFVAAPFLFLLAEWGFEGAGIYIDGINVTSHFHADVWLWLPLIFVLGVLGLFLMLHLARGVGYLHGQIAKVLLVRYPAN
jgi:uncharacterized membrane protein